MSVVFYMYLKERLYDIDKMRMLAKSKYFTDWIALNQFSTSYYRIQMTQVSLNVRSN